MWNRQAYLEVGHWLLRVCLTQAFLGGGGFSLRPVCFLVNNYRTTYTPTRDPEATEPSDHKPKIL